MQFSHLGTIAVGGISICFRINLGLIAGEKYILLGLTHFESVCLPQNTPHRLVIFSAVASCMDNKIINSTFVDNIIHIIWFLIHKVYYYHL